MILNDSESQKIGAASTIGPVTTNTDSNDIFWAIRRCLKTNTILIHSLSYSNESYTEDFLCHDEEYMKHDTEEK